MNRPVNEAEKIYYAIFKGKISNVVRERFEKISEEIERSYSEGEKERYYRCIYKVNDLEALEIATRVLKRIPILTDKFNVMVYLAETVPENYHLFINERTHGFTAWVVLFISLCRSALKLLKGVFLYAVL